MKPGWKTTEFWLTMAPQVLAALTASGLLVTSKEVAVMNLAVAILALLGYTASRTAIKKSLAASPFEAPEISGQEQEDLEPDDHAKVNDELRQLTERENAPEDHVQQFPSGIIDPKATAHFVLQCPEGFETSGLAIDKKDAAALEVVSLKVGSESLLPTPVSATLFVLDPDGGFIAFKNVSIASTASIIIGIRNTSDLPAEFKAAIIGVIHKNPEE